MSRLALVILAAGASRRFGATKQLALMNGKPMLARVVDQCRDIRDVDLHVALGAHRDAIAARVNLAGLTVIHAARWHEGMGSTIGDAVSVLQHAYDGILFLAGDQPLVGPGQLAPMIMRWRQQKNLSCCAVYNDTLGIPAIFPRRLFPELVALEGVHGARKVLLGQEGELLTFAIPEAGVDIDSPRDLKKVID